MQDLFEKMMNSIKSMVVNIHGEPVKLCVTDSLLFEELGAELSQFRSRVEHAEGPNISIYLLENEKKYFSKKERKNIQSLKKIRLTCEIDNFTDVANWRTFFFARKGWNLNEAVILILSQLGYLLRLKLSLKYKIAVFHAASLEYEEQGILLAGDSGAGKTSLSFLCVKQGFRYLSDEDSFVACHPERGAFELLGFQRRMRIHENMGRRKVDFRNSGDQFSSFGESGMVYDPRNENPAAYCLRAPLRKLIILNNRADNETLSLQKLPSARRFSFLMKYFESASLEYGNSRKRIARYNRQGFNLIFRLSQELDVYVLHYHFQKHYHAIPSKLKSVLKPNGINEENSTEKKLTEIVEGKKFQGELVSS